MPDSMVKEGAEKVFLANNFRVLKERGFSRAARRQTGESGFGL